MTGVAGVGRHLCTPGAQTAGGRSGLGGSHSRSLGEHGSGSRAVSGARLEATEIQWSNRRLEDQAECEESAGWRRGARGRLKRGLRCAANTCDDAGASNGREGERRSTVSRAHAMDMQTGMSPNWPGQQPTLAHQTVARACRQLQTRTALLLTCQSAPGRNHGASSAVASARPGRAACQPHGQAARRPEPAFRTRSLACQAWAGIASGRTADCPDPMAPWPPGYMAARLLLAPWLPARPPAWPASGVPFLPCLPRAD